MSIFMRLKELEDAGKVFRVDAPHGFSAKRGLYITEPLKKLLDNPTSSVGFHGGRPHIARIFERWVKGETMTIRLGGHNPAAFIAQLDPPPPDVWELRVTEPIVQFRIFCRFVAQDVILATAVRSRNELGKRKTKSGQRAQAWKEAMGDCEKQWNDCFPNHTVHPGIEAGHFLTEFVDV